MATKSTATNLEEFMQDDSEFKTAIKKLASKSRDAHEKQKDESKVINSILFPLIRALGYDPFNDEEVIPQFVADVGTRQGEKVDFAIAINDEPAMLVEAKNATEFLGSITHRNQLYRYFTTTDVRIAILTNGIDAWFYSDLNKPNVMDDEPFFKFNFQNASNDDINFLKLFCKNNFSIHDIIGQARTLKNADKIKNYIKTDIINPSNDIVHLIGKAIMGNRPKKHEIETFRKSIKSAFAELLQDSKQTISTPEASTAKPAPVPKTQSKNQPADRHQNPTPEVQAIYERYNEAIKAIAPDITHEAKKVCFAYRRGKIAFLWLNCRAKEIRINLKLNSLADLGDFPKGCISYGDKTHWGGGNHHITIDENSDYNYVMQQIRKAYEKAGN